MQLIVVTLCSASLNLHFQVLFTPQHFGLHIKKKYIGQYSYVWGQCINIFYFFKEIKGAIGNCLQKHFCYACWKSLHIPIAIIKLSSLNVFIYSVEGIGPRNVHPIKTLGSSVLIVFPICLSSSVFAYLFAPCSYRQDTSSPSSPPSPPFHNI